MKNKVIKITLLVTIILAIFNMYPVYASDPSINPGYWEPTIEDNTSTKFERSVERMLGYINAIGTIISVIILVIVGLKYMLGSVEAKAEYKKTMLGYIIGAILLFSASTIPNVLYNLGTSIGNNDNSTPAPALPPGKYVPFEE